MIKCAASLNPGLDFRVGDIRELSLPAASLVGLVAFYSIVHFDAVELDGVMFQLRRVLAPGGLALVSFHMGDQDQVVHVDDLFGAPVTLDFRFMHQALSPRPCGLLTSLSSNVWNVSPTRAWSIEVVVATCSHGLPNIGLQTALVDNKRRPRPDTSSSLRSRRSVRRT
jgi:SAM-dependent methyltransferase